MLRRPVLSFIVEGHADNITVEAEVFTTCRNTPPPKSLQPATANCLTMDTGDYCYDRKKITDMCSLAFVSAHSSRPIVPSRS